MSGHVRHNCGWVNLTTAGTPLVLPDVLSEYTPYGLWLSLANSRADLVCHWEDSDVVAQEVFANVRVQYPLTLP